MNIGHKLIYNCRYQKVSILLHKKLNHIFIHQKIGEGEESGRGGGI